MKKTENAQVILAILTGILISIPLFFGVFVEEANAQTIPDADTTPATAAPEDAATVEIISRESVLAAANTADMAVETAEAVEVMPAEPEPEPVPEPEPSVDQEILGSDQAKRYLALPESDRQYISSLCEAYAASEPIVLGICYNETRFTPTLTNLNTNGTTDWGVAQCNDVTYDVLAKGMGLRSMSDLLDLRTGVEACCVLIAYYKSTYGLADYDALLAYQEGYGNYRACKRGEQVPWAAYEAVKANAQIYEQLLNGAL